MAQGEVLFTTGSSVTPASAPKLVPTGNGIIDVVRDFSWTLSPQAARTEVPAIALEEFELKESGLNSAMNRWTYGLTQGQAANKPYYGMYPSNPTGFKYKLPYFANEYRVLSNGWVNSESLTTLPFAKYIPVAREYAGVGLLEAIAKFWNVGVGHEVQQAYSEGSAEALTVAFVLLNTTNISDVKRNWSFQYLFSYQNLQNRKSSILVDPPVIYTVVIAGVKYSPAMYVKQFAIANLGQSKLIQIDGHWQNVPEAYGIVITLQDLIPQSKNMLHAMRTEDFTQIIATDVGPLDFNTLQNKILPGQVPPEEIPPPGQGRPPLN